MPIPKPLLLSALGAAGLAASVVAQQAAPVAPAAPVAAVAPVGGLTVVVDDDLPPPAPRPPVYAQSTPRADMRPPIAQGGFGGSGYGVTLYHPFGDDPKARELAKKLVDAKDDEAKDKLRGELKVALTKAFDERLKGQDKQVEEMEKQLKRLKEMVEKRKDARTAIVADRLAALEKEARGLGW